MVGLIGLPEASLQALMSLFVIPAMVGFGAYQKSYSKWRSKLPLKIKIGDRDPSFH